MLAGLSYNGTSMLFHSSLSPIRLIHSRRVRRVLMLLLLVFEKEEKKIQPAIFYSPTRMKEMEWKNFFFLLMPFLNTRVINCSGFFCILFYLFFIFFSFNSIRIIHHQKKAKIFFFPFLLRFFSHSDGGGLLYIMIFFHTLKIITCA